MPLRSAAGRSQQVSIPCGIGRPKPPACGSPDGSRFSAAGRSFAWQRPAARVRSCIPSQAAARKIRVQRVPFAAASFGGGLPLAAGSMRLRASARAVRRRPPRRTAGSQAGCSPPLPPPSANVGLLGFAHRTSRQPSENARPTAPAAVGERAASVLRTETEQTGFGRSVRSGPLPRRQAVRNRPSRKKMKNQ